MSDGTPEATISPRVVHQVPWLLSIVTRLFELATFMLMLLWVYTSLGGLGLHPKVLAPKHGEVNNDTFPIFNWHPLLMTLAFPVFMAEALLAYKAPLAKELERGQKKVLHAGLHTAAIFCIILGVVAAFKSHTLKLPIPIPNLYSPHSYLGLLTFILSLLQYLVGLGGFVYPKFSTQHRTTLSPYHVFLGRATFTLGLTTMAVGIQEKTTFMQLNMKLPNSALYSKYLKIPATLLLFLALVGALVLYHHSHSPTSSKLSESDVLLDDELQDPRQ